MFQVRLDWQRYDFGGLELQSQRAAEADWTSLGVKTAVEFTDARPPLVAGQPEVRRYRAIFVLNDAMVGLWSNVVSVTVNGVHPPEKVSMPRAGAEIAGEWRPPA
ncbi:MAG: hypothetical protein NTX56_20320 [Proteobacteria bacterium]|nr:hypothetical protein [Pseudomonadota bacterium]